MNILEPFKVEWDLHELGDKPPAQYVVPDLASTLDFSRLEYGRAVAAGYVPANERRFDDHEAA